MRAVTLHVGPVAAAAARVWIANSRRLVAAVKTRPPGAKLGLSDAALDLIDAYLEMWLAVAEAEEETFAWSSEVDVDDIEVLVDQWVRLAALSDEERAALDWDWAPEWTAPMYEAVLAGVLEALRQSPRTAEYAERLQQRPPGTP